MAETKLLVDLLALSRFFLATTPSIVYAKDFLGGHSKTRKKERKKETFAQIFNIKTFARKTIEGGIAERWMGEKKRSPNPVI